MNPVSRRSAETGLMPKREETVSSSALGIGLLAIALPQDTLVLAHRQLQLLIAQQRQVDAHPSQSRGIELSADQSLLEIRRFGDAFAIRSDDLGASPEV